jgi:hypothetical protein
MTQLQEWSVGPGIWRTKKVKEVWTPEDIHATVIKFRTADHGSMSWLRERLGAYFYGGHGYKHLIKHIGLESARNMELR